MIDHEELLHFLDAVVWEADPGTLRFTFVNQKAEAMLGYSVSMWLTKDSFWSAIIHPDDQERILQARVEAVQSCSDHQLDYRVVTAEGRTVWIHDVVRVASRNGLAVKLVGLMVDITELQQEQQRAMCELERAREQIRRVQRVDVVGQLAGGIVHDFNNLTTVIVGYCEMILQQLTTNTPLRRDVEEIHKAGKSAASLTQQLLAFSRKQILQPQILDLNVVVSQMSELLGRLISEDIQLEMRLATPLDHISADSGQIEQVVMNLALNARDAMPDGGTLLIETGNVELDADYVAHHPGSSAGPHVTLVVTDTGAGMQEGVQEHIFEPFFTTKEPGRGTGLGLATVYRIVRQNGGSICAYSEYGRGSTFKAFFPRAERPGAAPASEFAPE